jgi:hypothetical protein
MCAPAADASSKSLLKMLELRVLFRPESNLYLNKIPRWSVSHTHKKSKKHCLDAKDTVMNNSDKAPCSYGIYILVGKDNTIYP